MKKTFALLAITTSLSACSLVPEYMRPDIAMPDHWKGAEAPLNTAATVDNAWWTGFNSAELNALEAEALEHNNDLRAALARIEQLRAALTIAGAPLLPELNASGNATRSDTNNSRSDDSFRAGLALSYEVDLFGRNRAQRDSARYDLNAGEFDREALALMVAGDVATGYFSVLTLHERLLIAQDNLSRAEDVFRIIEAQYNEGRISGLELSQQQVELASSRAQLSAIRNQTEQARNALAVLLGKAPQNLTLGADTLAGVVAPAVPLSLPAEVIARRPDIQSAEAGLRAVNADVGVARANLFPRLTLGADATALADPSGTATSLAASLIQPIFQGGALRAQVRLSEARQRELAEGYRKAVLVAFQEVENALAGVKAARERQEFFLQAAQQADKAYTIAKEQFEAGAIDFQTLLLTQRAQLSASDSFHQSKLELLSAHVQLFRALGGGYA